MTCMAALVHLVRHAEVDNPAHLVYADLPGFGLSPHGIEQARRVGRYLGPRPVVAIWSSPLERALRTAEEIASRTGVPVKVDPGLTEWAVIGRWKGHAWRLYGPPVLRLTQSGCAASMRCHAPDAHKARVERRPSREPDEHRYEKNCGAATPALRPEGG